MKRHDIPTLVGTSKVVLEKHVLCRKRVTSYSVTGIQRLSVSRFEIRLKILSGKRLETFFTKTLTAKLLVIITECECIAMSWNNLEVMGAVQNI
jgi:hypothetical protein